MMLNNNLVDLITGCRLIGGILIIGGFYIVICGKQMERRRSALALKCSTNPAGLGDTKQSDLEEPLLS